MLTWSSSYFFTWGWFFLNIVIMLALVGGMLATLYYAFLFFYRASKKLKD